MKQNEQQKTPKVAIVYDRVNTSYGGAEVVLTAIHEIFPEAPIFTSVYHSKKAQWAKKIKIIPSFLQKIPFFKDKHQFLLPLMPLAFESFDLSQFNLIISVTSAEAKGVLTKPNQIHLCYLLTPTRYLYSHRKEYLQSNWVLHLPIVKQISKAILNHIEKWDVTASLRPDIIIPISKLVAHRVKKYYGRNTTPVIYPPSSISLTLSQIDAIPTLNGFRKFYLSVSRLVEYKRIDISIQACRILKKPLVVVGEGNAKQKLYELAETDACIRQKKESIQNFLERATQENKIILFTGKLAKKDVYLLFKNCEALLMPGQEDFGITALEAGIFGKPVILFYTSGVAELLKDSQHAIHLTKETVPEMVYALGKLEELNFDAERLREHASQFTVKRFQQELKKRIQKEMKGQYVIS